MSSIEEATSPVGSGFGVHASEAVFGLRSRWLPIGHERIHYHDEGTGTPAMLVHGSAIGVSAAANWWRTIPALAGQARVVAPDLTGYGWTQPDPDEQWGFAGWQAQLLRFLDALGIDRVVFVGNSLGGRLGLRLALTRPDRFLGLVLMGTGGPGYRRSKTLSDHTEPEFSRAGIRQVMTDLVADPAVVTDDLVDFRYRLATMPGGPERWQRAVQARNASISDHGVTEDELRGLQVPTLVLQGREDKVVGVDSGVRLQAIIPDADLHVFAHCGHWVQIEREPDFNEAVAAFVRRVAASNSTATTTQGATR